MNFTPFNNTFVNASFYGVLSAFILLILSAIFNKYFPAFNKYLPVWVCKVFGWHLAPLEQEFDGSSKNGVCLRCGKRLLQDSQGNWF